MTDYEKLEDLVKKFDPYNKLWELVFEFDGEKNEWCTGPMTKISHPVVEKRIDNTLRELAKLKKVFDGVSDEALQVVNDGREDIITFKKKMPLIELMTTEAMLRKKDNNLIYWKEVFVACGLDEEPKEDTTLDEMVNMGLLDKEKMEKIEEISRTAEKQWALETKLNEMIEKIRQ